MTQLMGKVAIITGASKGIGAGIEHVARVAVFLASDEAAWLTGERISASGGWR